MSIAQSSDLIFRFLGGAPAAHILLKEKIMQSTIQIFKLDEVKKGTSKKTGNPYEIHTAQAALIDENGAVDTVGVLDIPPALREGIRPGVFTGDFALKTNFSNGRIEAVLTGLRPYPQAARPKSPTDNLKA